MLAQRPSPPTGIKGNWVDLSPLYGVTWEPSNRMEALVKPVKCDPVILQMARAALIDKLRSRLEPVISDYDDMRTR